MVCVKQELHNTRLSWQEYYIQIGIWESDISPSIAEAQEGKDF